MPFSSSQKSVANKLEVKVAGVTLDALGRKWDPAKHPRDSRGRFIETGGIVRVGLGELGKVVRSMVGGKVEVQMADGSDRIVPHQQLTMIRRPDGSAPTMSVAKVAKEDSARDAHPKRGDGKLARDLNPDLAIPHEDPKDEHLHAENDDDTAKHPVPEAYTPSREDAQVGDMVAITARNKKGDPQHILARVESVKDGQPDKVRLAGAQGRVMHRSELPGEASWDTVIPREDLKDPHGLFEDAGDGAKPAVFDSEEAADLVEGHANATAVNKPSAEAAPRPFTVGDSPNDIGMVTGAKDGSVEYRGQVVGRIQKQTDGTFKVTDAQGNHVGTAKSWDNGRGMLARRLVKIANSPQAKKKPADKKPVADRSPGARGRGATSIVTTDEGQKGYLSRSGNLLATGSNGKTWGVYRKTDSPESAIHHTVTINGQHYEHVGDGTLAEFRQVWAGSAEDHANGEKPNVPNVPEQAAPAVPQAPAAPQQPVAAPNAPEVPQAPERQAIDSRPVSMSHIEPGSLFVGSDDKIHRVKDKRDNGNGSTTLVAEDGSLHNFHDSAPVPTEAAVREHGIAAPNAPEAPAAPQKPVGRGAAQVASADQAAMEQARQDAQAHDTALAERIGEAQDQNTLDAIEREVQQIQSAPRRSNLLTALTAKREKVGRSSQEGQHEQAAAHEAPKAPEAPVKAPPRPKNDATPSYPENTTPEGATPHDAEQGSSTHEDVLRDVPAEQGGGAGRPGDVLPAAREGDRQEGQGPRDGAGRDGQPGRGLPDEAGSAQHSEEAGRGEGSGRTPVRGGTGAGDRGQGAPAAADSGRDQGGVAKDEGPYKPPADAPKFHPQSQADLQPKGDFPKAEANVAAVELLRKLEAERRPATPDEQKVLARWGGWGAAWRIFQPEKYPEYQGLHDRLRSLLNDEEWKRAERNSTNAHYTDADYVQTMWEAVEDLGFDGGRVLEPGSGAGTFIGFAPDDAQMYGVELDPTSAKISQFLYPDAHVRNQRFEDFKVPDGTFDLTIGNVPFGDLPFVDKESNPQGHMLHNAAIVKSLKKTRPGGLVAVLTSHHTMDADGPKGRKARQEMADLGDLVAAVRLPSKAHDRAAGTAVVTDMLIFRKRAEGDKPGDQSWVKSSKMKVGDGEAPVNSYFQKHPENVLGTYSLGGLRKDELSVNGNPNAGADFKAAVDRVVADAKDAGNGHVAAAPGTKHEPLDLTDPTETSHEGFVGEGDKVFERTVTHNADGSLKDKPLHQKTTFTQIENGVVKPFWVSNAQQPELRQLIRMRDLTKALLTEEGRSEKDTPRIKQIRAELNKTYDAYVKKYGAINRFKWARTGRIDKETGEEKMRRNMPQMGGFRDDPASALVYALERFDPETQTASKASIFTKRTVSKRQIATTADSPSDAVALSVETHGHVDLPSIAKMLGVSEQEARQRIDGLVFENHDGSGQLVPREEYLSGDVRAKLKEATAAAEDNPALFSNVAALEAVVPEDLTAGEIDGRMGAAWIGEEDVQAFLREILADPSVRVEHGGGNVWGVAGKKGSVAATDEWGTTRKSAIDIAEKLLTGKTIVVEDTLKTPDGDKRVINQAETEAAQAKAEDMQERFSAWLWEDPERAQRLQDAYNDKFNGIVLREYDTSPLALPGLSERFTLRSHQNAAIRRIVNEPAALLAHEVGAGKTLEMVGGVMELRRLGLAKKPAIVVPNHMLEQFSREFLEAYPNANILAAGSDDLKGDRRRRFVARAATGDWDAVILTHSSFEKIGMQKERQKAYLEKQIAGIREQLAKQEERGERNSLTFKDLQKILERREAKIKEKLDKLGDDTGTSFEETGIDYLMVDEAHEFKNLTRWSNRRDLAIEGADKATDLDMKIDYLRNSNESGRVVTFATATPIANSIGEAYTMQQYLRPDLLHNAGIPDFDTWVSTFGTTVNEMEVAPTGGFRMKERFKKFRNVPELLKMFRVAADVKTAEDLGLPTPEIINKGDAQNIIIPASEEFQDFNAQALEDAAQDDSPAAVLKYITKVSQGSLDLRLAGQDGPPDKLAAAAQNIATIHERTKGREYPIDAKDPSAGMQPAKGSLQVVFSDTGTPNDEEGRFNAYEALRDMLVKDHGFDRSSIRFIHEAKNDQQKAELFNDCRTGKVNVLIGSTKKMGVGTNVQDRAVALHHLDCPWRPADLQQRDGRVDRQGNLNGPYDPSRGSFGNEAGIEMYRYVTEGSIDAYRWQTVKDKSVFIGQMMRGKLDVREIDDLSEQSMSLAVATALAAGNPHLLEKARADEEVKRLARLDRKHHDSQRALKGRVTQTQAAIGVTGDRIKKYDEALTKAENLEDNFKVEVLGHGKFSKRTEGGEALSVALAAIAKEHVSGREGREHEIAKFGGFTMTAQVVNRPGEQKKIKVELRGVPATAYEYPIEVQKTTGGGVLTRMQNRIEGIESRRDEDVRKLAGLRDELGKIHDRIGLDSPHADPLADAKNKADLLKKLIEATENTEGGDPEKRAAEASRIQRELAVLNEKSKAAKASTEAQAIEDDTADRLILESGVMDDTVQELGMGDRAPSERAPRTGSSSSGSSSSGTSGTRKPAAAADQAEGDTMTIAPEDLPQVDEPATGDTPEHAPEVAAGGNGADEPPALEAPAAADEPSPADEPTHTVTPDEHAANEASYDDGAGDTIGNADEWGSEEDTSLPDEGQKFVGSGGQVFTMGPHETTFDGNYTATDEHGQEHEFSLDDLQGWEPYEAPQDEQDTALDGLDVPEDAPAAPQAGQRTPGDRKPQEGTRKPSGAAPSKQGALDIQDTHGDENQPSLNDAIAEQEAENTPAAPAAAPAAADGASTQGSTLADGTPVPDAMADEAPKDPANYDQYGMGKVTRQPGALYVDTIDGEANIARQEDGTWALTYPGRHTPDDVYPTQRDALAALHGHMREQHGTESTPAADAPQAPAAEEAVTPEPDGPTPDERTDAEARAEAEAAHAADLTDREHADEATSSADMQGERPVPPAPVDEQHAEDLAYEPKTPVQMPDEKFPLTPQAQRIADAAVADQEDVLAEAGAGAGKTTILAGIARREKAVRPDTKIAYVAFNKSVQIEAEGRMPDNVEPRTGHSIAFQWAGKDFTSKKDRFGQLRRADEIADHLGIKDMTTEGGDTIEAARVAQGVMRAVDTYANSAEDKIGSEHLPEVLSDLSNADKRKVLAFANKAWDDLTDKNGKINMSFDHIRKMWALSKPDFSKPGSGLERPAHMLFLDEAQDTPPVLAKVIEDQHIRKVIVGDTNQAIYGFTGAIDYLKKAKVKLRLPLTKSFRFGPQVADWGNRFLQVLGAKERVQGGGPDSSIVRGMDAPDAILVRSNGGMIGEILREQQAGRLVGVPKGTKSDLRSLVDSARYLKGEGPAPERMHEDLAAFRTWQEFEDEAAKGEDQKLAMLDRIISENGLGQLDNIVSQVQELEDDPLAGVKTKVTGGKLTLTGKGLFMLNKRLKETDPNPHPTYGGKGIGRAGFRWNKTDKTWEFYGDEAAREKAMENLRTLAASNAQEPDVVVSTAHKAKGLEWARVRIGDDFKGPTVDKNTGELIMPSDEELKLAYVAVTRAEKELDPGSLSWVEGYSTPNGEGHAPKPDDKVTVSPESLPAAPEVDAPEASTPDTVDAEAPAADAPEADAPVTLSPEQVAADRADLGTEPTPEPEVTPEVAAEAKDAGVDVAANESRLDAHDEHARTPEAAKRLADAEKALDYITSGDFTADVEWTERKGKGGSTQLDAELNGYRVETYSGGVGVNKLIKYRTYDPQGNVVSNEYWDKTGMIPNGATTKAEAEEMVKRSMLSDLEKALAAPAYREHEDAMWAARQTLRPDENGQVERPEWMRGLDQDQAEGLLGEGVPADFLRPGTRVRGYRLDQELRNHKGEPAVDEHGQRIRQEYVTGEWVPSTFLGLDADGVAVLRDDEGNVWRDIADPSRGKPAGQRKFDPSFAGEPTWDERMAAVEKQREADAAEAMQALEDRRQAEEDAVAGPDDGEPTGYEDASDEAILDSRDDSGDERERKAKERRRRRHKRRNPLNNVPNNNSNNAGGMGGGPLGANPGVGDLPLDAGHKPGGGSGSGAGHAAGNAAANAAGDTAGSGISPQAQAQMNREALGAQVIESGKAPADMTDEELRAASEHLGAQIQQAMASHQPAVARDLMDRLKGIVTEGDRRGKEQASAQRAEDRAALAEKGPRPEAGVGEMGVLSEVAGRFARGDHLADNQNGVSQVGLNPIALRKAIEHGNLTVEDTGTSNTEGGRYRLHLTDAGREQLRRGLAHNEFKPDHQVQAKGGTAAEVQSYLDGHDAGSFPGPAVASAPSGEAAAGTDLPFTPTKVMADGLHVGDVIEGKLTNGERGKITVESVEQQGTMLLVTGTDENGNRAYVRTPVATPSVTLHEPAPEGSQEAWNAPVENKPQAGPGPELPANLRVGDVIEANVTRGRGKVKAKVRVLSEPQKSGFNHRVQVAQVFADGAEGKPEYVNLPGNRPVNVLERAAEGNAPEAGDHSTAAPDNLPGGDLGTDGTPADATPAAAETAAQDLVESRPEPMVNGNLRNPDGMVLPTDSTGRYEPEQIAYMADHGQQATINVGDEWHIGHFRGVEGGKDNPEYLFDEIGGAQDSPLRFTPDQLHEVRGLRQAEIPGEAVHANDLQPGTRVAFQRGGKQHVGMLTGVNGEGRAMVRDANGVVHESNQDGMVRPIFGAYLPGAEPKERPFAPEPGIWTQEADGRWGMGVPGEYSAGIAPDGQGGYQWEVQGVRGSGLSGARGSVDSVEAAKAAVENAVWDMAADPHQGNPSMLPGDGADERDRKTRELTDTLAELAATNETTPESGIEGGDTAETTPTVEGQPAGWVPTGELEPGDIAHVEGDSDGSATTRTGHVLGTPESVQVHVPGKIPENGWTIVIGDHHDGSGDRGTVLTPEDGVSARAERPDSAGDDDNPQSAAESQVLTDHVGDAVPADKNGVGVFPGSVVVDGGGREGVVTDVTAMDVGVRWTGGHKDVRTQAGTLTVHPDKQNRPEGWTATGQKIIPGRQIVEANGHQGPVTSLEGDRVGITTPDGVQYADAADVKVVGAVRDGEPAKGNVEPTFDVPASPEGLDTREKAPVKPDALPEGTPTGIPNLTPDMAKALNNLGLDHDQTSHNDVRQAAARLRHGMPISADQADALAAELGQRIDAKDVPAGEARKVKRVRNRLAATAERLRGQEPTPAEPEAAPAVATKITDVAEGDVIAVPNPATGQAEVGIVITKAPAVVREDGTTNPHVFDVTVELADGSRVTHPIHEDAEVYRLPDLPAPDQAPNLGPVDDNTPFTEPRVNDRLHDSADAVTENALADAETADSLDSLGEKVNEALDSRADAGDQHNASRRTETALEQSGVDEEAAQEAHDAADQQAEQVAEQVADTMRNTVEDAEPLPGESEEEAASRWANRLKQTAEQVDYDKATQQALDGAGQPRALPSGRQQAQARRQVQDALRADLFSFADQLAALGDTASANEIAAIAARLAGRPDDAQVRRAVEAAAMGQEPGKIRSLWERIKGIFRRARLKFLDAVKGLMGKGRKARRSLRAAVEAARKEWNGDNSEVRGLVDDAAKHLGNGGDAIADHAPSEPAGFAERMAFWRGKLPESADAFAKAEVRAPFYRRLTLDVLRGGRTVGAEHTTGLRLDRAADGGPGQTALGHLDALKGMGRAVDDEVHARVRAALPDLGDDPEANVREAQRFADGLMGDERGDLTDAELTHLAKKARAEAEDKATRYANARAQALRDVLASQRSMGPKGAQRLNVQGRSEKAAEVKALRWAEQHVPTDWLAAAGTVEAKAGRMGGYEDNGTITVAPLGEARVDGSGKYGASALHGLAHHLEATVPGLSAAQWAYHHTRTSDGQPGARKRRGRNGLGWLRDLYPALGMNKGHGKGRAGDFPNPWAGIEHDGGQHHEVLPLALEELFASPKYVQGDYDMRQFLLGMLSWIGRN